MKKRSIYWWAFVISGSIWAIVSIIIMMIFMGIMDDIENNILGSYGPIVLWGASVFSAGAFLITLVTWLVCKREMTFLYFLLGITPFFLCMFIILPTETCSIGYNMAFSNWNTNPTPETETVLKTARTRIYRQNAAIRFTAAGLLVVNIFAIYRVRKAIRNKVQSARG